MTGWYPGKTLEIERQVAGELLSPELLGHLRDGLNCNTATQEREAVGISQRRNWRGTMPRVVLGQSYRDCS